MIRPYTKDDYSKLYEWWKAWKWDPVPPHFLPDIGLVCDEMAAGFLYTTNSPIHWVEWLISDPLVPINVRSEAVDTVLNSLCDIAHKRGAKAIFTSTNKKSLEDRLLKHGFTPSDRDVTQLFRFLGE